MNAGRRVLFAVVCFNLFAGCGPEAAPPSAGGDGPTAAQVQALQGQTLPLVQADGPLAQVVYKDLVVSWTRWALEAPFSTGALTDPTGAACAQGQHGPVWMLAGTTGGAVSRSCTIPAQKLLFFPILNDWVVVPNELVSTPADAAEVKSEVHDYFVAQRAAACSLSLKLDGHPLLPDTAAIDAHQYVELRKPFSVDLLADNYAGAPAGRYDFTLADGTYALLTPLAKGHHTLEFSGQSCDSGSVVFETSATYDLDVQ